MFEKNRSGNFSLSARPEIAYIDVGRKCRSLVRSIFDADVASRAISECVRAIIATAKWRLLVAFRARFAGRRERQHSKLGECATSGQNLKATRKRKKGWVNEHRG